MFNIIYNISKYVYIYNIFYIGKYVYINYIIYIILQVRTVKPVYNGHPWDLKKVAV